MIFYQLVPTNAWSGMGKKSRTVAIARGGEKRVTISDFKYNAK